MSRPRQRTRIAILGTLANVPFAGMAWMHGQFLMGLQRLGCDAFYVETTSAWPYHPHMQTTTDDPTYAVKYLAGVMRGFGAQEKWAYRASFADRAWHGPLASGAEDMIAGADAVLNISGSTTPEELGIDCPLVYIGTDPVVQELRIANGDDALRSRIGAHRAHFTYGENIGKPDCPVPPLPFATKPTRQPIVLDLWSGGVVRGSRCYTTVTNWAVTGYDVEYQGETYSWSKHHEYLKIIGLPAHARSRGVKFELAMGLSGVSDEVKRMLGENGWEISDAFEMSLDPWPYRDYIRNSACEFSVAKDMNVRMASGWFSERSACYLAAGRPVITQDTGFSRVIPVGNGLFAFRNEDDILGAIDAIESDYEAHSRAALDIARESFCAEKVLGRLLDDLGL